MGAATAAVALLGAACGSSGSSGGGASGSGGTIASKFVFGAPPDCATNKFCAIGLKNLYGITFKQIKTTDFGGPITVQALKSGAVQVGELFSTAVYDPSFVTLTDDKHLEASDNIVPVIRQAVDTPQIDKILNDISAQLTTSEMLELNKMVDVSQQDPAAVAKSFLSQKGLGTATTGCTGHLTVGVSGNFSESKIVAEMYGQALQHAGCTVAYQLDLSSRKVSDTALFSGQIDLKPEYLASESTAQQSSASVSGDAQNNATILKGLLKAKSVNVLDFAPAIDTNVFVVTKATASKYGLSTVSDLAKT
ncbi:MAG TPA: glycine betaine ABC transporter substrate-binding protein [Acidimicrobiales bacterium]|nr:glycine betaine ABC transporter substrate-binding protein [Acidimicrobiales bacterium]